MGWQAQYQPDSEIEQLGKILSHQIQCVVRVAPLHWNHPALECQCGCVFSLFVLQGAREANNWTHIVDEHKKVKELNNK